MELSIINDPAGTTIQVKVDETTTLRSLPLFNEQVARNLAGLVQRVGLHAYRNWVPQSVATHLFNTFALERAAREATNAKGV